MRLRLSKIVRSRAGRGRSAARFRAMTPCCNTAITLLRRGGGADGSQVCRVVDHLFRLLARTILLSVRVDALRPVLGSNAVASAVIFCASRPRKSDKGTVPISSSWVDPVIDLTKFFSIHCLNPKFVGFSTKSSVGCIPAWNLS